MKIEILQEELLRGLNVVLRAVSSRTQLPVLSAVKIEAEKTELILSATDLEIGIRYRVAAKVGEVGVVAVPAKTLYELLTTLKPGKLVLELREQNLMIKMPGFVGKVLTVNPEEFPALPEPKTPLITLRGSELARGVEKVAFASARDSLRPVLTGVLLEISQNLRLVATDGFRLAVASLGIKGSAANGSVTMLIPARALGEVVKIMREGEVTIEYLAESKQVLFSGEGILLVSQVIEGNFPDYNRILPKEFVVNVEAGREELLSAVKTAQVFAKDNANMMRWKVGGGKIAITASAGGSGEGVIEVEVKTEGEDVEVVFNVKYVLDYLSLIEGEGVWIGLGGKLAPGMLAEAEEKKEQAFYVVMPINA